MQGMAENPGWPQGLLAADEREQSLLVFLCSGDSNPQVTRIANGGKV
jgi:hypothetical protein